MCWGAPLWHMAVCARRVVARLLATRGALVRSLAWLLALLCARQVVAWLLALCALVRLSPGCWRVGPVRRGARAGVWGSGVTLAGCFLALVCWLCSRRGLSK